MNSSPYKRAGWLCLASVGFVVAIAAVGLFAASSANAAGESGAHGEHAPSIFDLRWYWVNFVIYVGALWWLLKDTIVRGWAARRNAVAAEVSARTKELADAREALRVAEVKMQGVAQEISSLQDTIRKETSNERQQVLEEAERRVQRVDAQAKGTLMAELKSGEAQIQRRLAEMVLERSEAIVRATVTTENDRSKRNSVVAGVQALVGH